MEYHCDDGGKMNFVEDLVWFGFESGISECFPGSFPSCRDLESLSEEFFSLGFGFLTSRGVTSFLAFPSSFFFEGPACRFPQNAETSAARVGYPTRPENKKRLETNRSSHTHIVRFAILRHEIILIAGIHRMVNLSRMVLLARTAGRETLFLISDASHNFQIEENFCAPEDRRMIPTVATPPGTVQISSSRITKSLPLLCEIQAGKAPK